MVLEIPASTAGISAFSLIIEPDDNWQNSG
jgi:hypothetical protein